MGAVETCSGRPVDERVGRNGGRRSHPCHEVVNKHLDDEREVGRQCGRGAPK